MPLELQLNQTQKLVLTQSVLQSLNMLQLSVMDLNAYIRELSISNPVIEPVTDAEDRVSLEFLQESAETEPEPGTKETGPDIVSEYAYSTPGYKTGRKSGDPYAVSENPDYTAILSKEETFSFYLHGEAGLKKGLDPFTAYVLSYLIDSLDRRGYLDIPIQDIASELGIPVSDAEEALFILQSMQPAGVGARSLEECLIIQLAEQAVGQPAGNAAVPFTTLVRMVMDYLPLIAKQDYKKLASIFSISISEAREASLIIKKLNPIPSQGFYDDTPNPVIIPDAYIYAEDGNVRISMNTESLPGFRVDPYYKSLLDSDCDAGTKQYISKKLQEAAEAAEGIKNRTSTLERVILYIVRKQKRYFTEGASLEALTRTEVSGALNLSVSTISRAVKDKYVLYRSKLIPLGFFFANSVNADMEHGISSVFIKDELRRIIMGEDTAHPLSDTRISELFNSMGIKVSRRTIAKYRESLGIAPAFGRKAR